MISNKTDKVIQERPTLPLYHYTSQSGLLGMIEYRKMRATNIFYLNDASEYTYAANLILEVMRDRLMAITGERDTYRRTWALHSALGCRHSKTITDPSLPPDNRQCIFIESIMDIFEYLKDPPSVDQFYILSFTAREDDLSQWRGYCPHGIGFCLEFETTGLIEQIKKFDLSIVKCLYEEEKQKQEIRNILDRSMDGLKTVFDNFDKSEGKQNEAIKNLEFETFSGFMKLIPRLKDKAFEDENEWRVISAGKQFSAKFREGTSMVVPYVEIPLAGADAAPTEIIEPIKIIKRIFVGPTPHKMLSKKSVESLLKINKMEGCKVELSNVPYRTW